MKSFYHQTILVLFFLVVSVSMYGQSSLNLILTHQPLSPCSSNPVTLSVTDHYGGASIPPLNIGWNFGDGSPELWSMSTTVTHTYAPGTYQACVYMWDSIFATNDTTCITFTVSGTCPPVDEFTGTVYHDVNGNGVQDSGEPGISSLIEIPSLGQMVTPGAYGHYSLLLPAGTYSVNLIPLPYHSVTQPIGNSYTLTSTGSGASTGNFDFGITPIPGQPDMAVGIFSTPHVPGFNKTITTSIRNFGTQTMSGTVSVTLDPNLTFVNAMNGGTHSGGVVTFPYNSVAPGQYQLFLMTVNVSPSLLIGDTVRYSAIVNPVVGDMDPINNYDSLKLPVVASYDPNDKASRAAGMGPNGEINAGDVLTYTVRFQNTGNFPATFIFIRDTLDANLDWSSLRVLSASHTMWHTQNSDKIEFFFNNINLPDSTTDEPNSHGFVMYSIKAKSTLAPGEEIANTAHIYFDYNPPVVTNTTLNTVWIPTHAEAPIAEMNVVLFPNPMVTEAKLRFDAQGESWTLRIIDLQGREMMERSGLREGEVQLVRNDLPAGTYLFQLVSETGKAATGKLMIQ